MIYTNYAKGLADVYGNKMPVSMTFQIKAVGKFSVTQGKWISFEQVGLVEATGVIESRINQKIRIKESQLSF